MNIRPLRNNVMFQFLDPTGGKKGAFHHVLAESGIILPPGESLQKQHRWGRVKAVGPDVVGVVPGDFILVEALMWMEGSVVGSEKVWKTDDTKILAVTNDERACQLQM